MAEIKQIRDAMRRKKRARLVTRISIAVILLSLAVVLVINRDKLTPESISNWLAGSISTSTEAEGFPVSLPSGETVSVFASGNNIALTNQTNLYLYNSRGKKIRSVQHLKKNVQSKSAGEYTLLYSVGATEFSVETPSKNVVDKESDMSVTMGEICKNGRFVLATESDVYTSELKVFDKNGNAVFKWSPSGGVITAVGISADGHHVAASTMFTQGGRIMSGIYFFETGKEEALFSSKIEDKMVTRLFCDKNSVRVVTDESLIDFDQNGEISGEYSFEERKLLGISQCSKGLALVFEDVNDPSRSVLSIVNEKSQESATASVPYKVLDISAHGGDIYLMTESLVLKYEATNAVKTGEKEIEDDAVKICSTSAAAYVVTASSQLLRIDI